MIDPNQFLDLIIKPSLGIMSLSSKTAEIMMLGTAMCESNLSYLKQICGPALGVYQMEPLTYSFLAAYLNRNVNLKSKVLSACYFDIMPPPDAMVYNLRLATIMARLRYWVIPDALPHESDIDGIIKYYLTFYNTHLGSATYDKVAPHFRHAELIANADS